MNDDFARGRKGDEFQCFLLLCVIGELNVNVGSASVSMESRRSFFNSFSPRYF